MRGGRSFRSYTCLGLTQELIGLLARELEKPEVAPAKMFYAQLVKQYLLGHYREHVEIEQLGELIHRSPNYTTALFKEVFGQSPIRYMHQLRLHEACRLLLHSDMTVADIAQYLGYPLSNIPPRSPASLTHLFRNYSNSFLNLLGPGLGNADPKELLLIQIVGQVEPLAGHNADVPLLKTLQ